MKSSSSSSLSDSDDLMRVHDGLTKINEIGFQLVAPLAFFSHPVKVKGGE